MPIKPMLCKLLVNPFNAIGWIWERKYDGVRMLAFVGPNGTRLQARSGTDKTKQFPEIAQLKCSTPMVLDGEVVPVDSTIKFQEFAQRRVNRTDDIEAVAAELPACLMAFDILSFDGQGLMSLPLVERKHILHNALPAGCSYVALIEQHTDGIELYNRACTLGWEGVVGKKLTQNYAEGKRLWVKVKCWQESTFKVAGFTQGTGKRANYFGALLLVNDRGKPVGEVGTGFTDAVLAALTKELKPLVVETEVRSGLTYSYLIADDYFPVRIKYLEVTNAEQLRFPVYLGKAK